MHTLVTIGMTALLNCRVKNLGDRAVSSFNYYSKNVFKRHIDRDDREKLSWDNLIQMSGPF